MNNSSCLVITEQTSDMNKNEGEFEPGTVLYIILSVCCYSI